MGGKQIGDAGQDGIDAFVAGHLCNRFCEDIGLEPPQSCSAAADDDNADDAFMDTILQPLQEDQVGQTTPLDQADIATAKSPTKRRSTKAKPVKATTTKAAKAKVVGKAKAATAKQSQPPEQPRPKPKPKARRVATATAATDDHAADVPFKITGSGRIVKPTQK